MLLKNYILFAALFASFTSFSQTAYPKITGHFGILQPFVTVSFQFGIAF